MKTQLWIPEPEPSPWDRLKCFFCFHDFEKVDEAVIHTVFCKKKCNSWIQYEFGIPVHGIVKCFKKYHVIKIKVTIEEKK
jgi:hypothetical protein